MGAGPGKAFKAVFVWTLVVLRGNQIRVEKEEGKKRDLLKDLKDSRVVQRIEDNNTEKLYLTVPTLCLSLIPTFRSDLSYHMWPT